MEAQKRWATLPKNGSGGWIVERFDTIDVDIVKLRDYCLSLTHPRGRHKARVFLACLGLTADNAEMVRTALIAAVRDRQLDIRTTTLDEYGQRYVLDFGMTTASGDAKIRSIWIVRTGEKVLRFTSCYVL
jgi:hypothetical protein